MKLGSWQNGTNNLQETTASFSTLVQQPLWSISFIHSSQTAHKE